MAALANGSFIVVWDSYGSAGSDTSDRSIQGQRLDSSGRPQGGQFQVNTYSYLNQEDPEVAVGTDGNFVVVWQSFGSAGSVTDTFSVQGQRFDAAGNEIGNEFQVNTNTAGQQREPKVTMDSDGDFAVVWNSLSGGGADTSGSSIQAQRYDSMGLPIGDEFLVNSCTTGTQNRPGLAVISQEVVHR